MKYPVCAEFLIRACEIEHQQSVSHTLRLLFTAFADMLNKAYLDGYVAATNEPHATKKE